MSAHRYREECADLPWIGGSYLGPRTMSRGDAAAIMACSHPAALALMHGYARSYMAVLGAVVLAPAVAGALWLWGHTTAAAITLVVGGTAGLVVMEARRRARQWEAVIAARLAQFRV